MEFSRKTLLFMLFVMIAALIIQFFIPHRSVQIAQPQSCGQGCKRYDVIVIGSEVQGMLLAKEAQNLGLSVLVLDPRLEPGGELIQGEMIFLDEPFDKHRKSLVQGEMKQLFDGYTRGKIRNMKQFDTYYEKLIKGLTLRSGITIQNVHETGTDGNRMVQSMMYKDQGKIHKVEAGYWVENTDFNAFTGKLKEKKRIPGMETIDKSKGANYMAATMMLKFKNVDWRALHKGVLKYYPLTNVEKVFGPNTYVDRYSAVGFSNVMAKYKAHQQQIKLRGLNMSYQGDGQVIINALLLYNVDPSSPSSVEGALQKGRAEAPYILQFLREHMLGFEHAELSGFPDYLYIRDFNRFETKYVLTVSDIQTDRMFWDNVSIGGYPIDLQGTENIPNGINYGTTDRYGIPLRSFELKSYDNVLVVGKNIGADIKAYGSARIMPNTALAAQSIGIILGYESGKKRLVDLTPEDFKRIHKYLQRDYGIRVAN